jgi:CRP-like cAMP-binding protein
MKDRNQLLEHLKDFSGMSEEDFMQSTSFWYNKSIRKGEFFNMQNFVCSDLGFITSGLFRIYYFDQQSMEEKNMFFFSKGQFIVSFRSFIRQYPCIYYIEALEDSELCAIKYKDLQGLYEINNSWSNLGRLLAELFFEYSQVRMEAFLFNTAEQRYITFLKDHPDIANRIPLFHLSSYLGIKSQSLSRMRKRIHNNARK